MPPCHGCGGCGDGDGDGTKCHKRDSFNACSKAVTTNEGVLLKAMILMIACYHSALLFGQTLSKLHKSM
eukprot:scaffold1318_cov116-Skeletonema_marinoi.AAC.4